MKRKSSAFPKKKELTKKRWSLQKPNSLAQKRAFARLWLTEARYHKYRYFVEKCSDGTRVYLARPTSLNKGVDFQVGLEGYCRKRRRRRNGKRPRRSERPSHDDIIHDLRRKVKEKPRLSRALFRAICDVFDCVEPRLAIRRERRIKNFESGLPSEKILLILKWLFIEQDITYWLGTGRNMLMHTIEKRVFRISGNLIQK
jgi:hypothetical protein